MARDGCLLALALATGRRAANLCQLRWLDFSTDAQFQQLWHLEHELAPQYQLYMRMLDKTHLTAPGPCIELNLAGVQHPSHGAVLWLAIYRKHLAAQRDNQPSLYLFRTLNKDCRQFSCQAVTAGALNKRLQLHMGAASLPADVTIHGVRRGAAQGMLQQHVPVPTAMQVLGMAAAGTFARYSDAQASTKRKHMS
jgi:integrase